MEDLVWLRKFKLDNHVIIDSDLAEEYYDKYIVTNSVSLDKSGKKLITFFDSNQDLDYYNLRKINVSVSISAAVTSYSRIVMSRFKNLAGKDLYYSDTDSLYKKGTLDEKYISNKELGKFKLERIFERCLYLAPKMYGGLYKKGNTFLEYVKIKGVKMQFHLNLYSH